MKKHLPVLLLICFILPHTAFGSGTSPVSNNGKKWRIGYYEGGPYSDYAETMKPLIESLIELGWINEKAVPDISGETPMPYWDWLTACDSPWLSFRPEDACSAEWEEKKRAIRKKEILAKLQSGSLDLIIAMGTWAGQDLANSTHSVPTMVLSTSDPVGAGIIKSVNNSGLSHVTARVDPGRYIRQIRMFHRLVGFKTLGVAFEDTPDGRLYSAIDTINRIAAKRGFKVVTCKVTDATSDTVKADKSCLDCYNQLSESSDAIYVTELTCTDRISEQLAEMFREYSIPSFSMVGSKNVKNGLLFSISDGAGYRALGMHNAVKFTRILNGEKPGDLDQFFEDPLEISVNIKTAKDIGFNVPKSILKIATEIYEK